MAKPMHISDVTDKSDNWRVKVLVVEKSNVYTNDRGKRLQKFMLLDDQGDRVEGLLWNTNINVLEESLKPFTTYVVGGAQIQTIKPGFQYATPGITQQWIFSRATFIRPVNDDAEKIPYPAIQEVPFTDIPLIADTSSTLDIVAVVIDVKEPRLVDVRGMLTPIRECKIVQYELSPLMLTLWGDFAEQQGTELFAMRNDMPIILCKGLKAKSFEGVSVSMIPFSFVSLEPTIPEVTRLRNWLDTHIEDVQQIGRNPTRNYLDATLATFNEAQAKTLSDILPDSQAVQCAVTMSIVDINQTVTYTVCPKCKQTQKALPDESFPCHTCNEEQIAEPRCKVVVHLTDQSCNINATLFDTCAESLLGNTPKKMHAMNKQEIANCMDDINRTLRGQQIIAQVRASRKKFNDRVTRYTVQHWLEKKFDKAAEAECHITGESANQTKAIEKSAAISTENNSGKKSKARSGTGTVSPTKCNATPIKKFKLKSTDED